MSDTNLLEGKAVLAVDDEPDILASLKDILDMCHVVTASTFEQASELLKSQDFDIVVLDIMGVDGYRLLDIANSRNIPAVMLTAHAFAPDHLVKSLKDGAASYLHKEEIIHLAAFLRDVLEAQQKRENPWRFWQERLPSSYFEKRWGAAWKETNKEFWEAFRASIKPRCPGPDENGE